MDPFNDAGQIIPSELARLARQSEAGARVFALPGGVFQQTPDGYAVPPLPPRGLWARVTAGPQSESQPLYSFAAVQDDGTGYGWVEVPGGLTGQYTASPSDESASVPADPTDGAVVWIEPDDSNPGLWKFFWEDAGFSFSAFLQGDFALAVGAGTKFNWQRSPLALTLPAGSYFLTGQVTGDVQVHQGPNDPAQLNAQLQITAGTAQLSGVPIVVLQTSVPGGGNVGSGLQSAFLQAQLVAQTPVVVTLFASVANAQDNVTIDYAVLRCGDKCLQGGTSLMALEVGGIQAGTVPAIASCADSSGSGSGGGGGGGGGSGPTFPDLCPGQQFNSTYLLTVSGACAALNGTYSLTWNGSSFWSWSGTIAGVAVTWFLSDLAGTPVLDYAEKGVSLNQSSASSFTCPPTFTAHGAMVLNHPAVTICPGQTINWSVS